MGKDKESGSDRWKKSMEEDRDGWEKEEKERVKKRELDGRSGL